ncbi:hypothetical protein M4V62_19005 [Streptomyces durmitorensis]|uniref:Secreted protein n=1 Tax=Streptomyces durmitorensis TaxID=319947 RepID=A0ABY4PUA7_9ACTN|nr:hypothetical protein [Streptomyces durmitorensis]UQT57022.1 hypothetical protein M4V62_19005 [Streptomyces durmitorensis]
MTTGISLVLAAASPALAGTEFGDGNVSGKKDGDTVAAVAKITYTSTGNNKGGGGPVASVDTNWTPPGCWYAPEWKATEFQEYRQRLYFGARHDPDAPRDVLGDMSDQNQAYAKDGYNIDKEKDGMWWGAQQNPNASMAEQFKCDREPFWVENGETPEDVPQVIDPEILAGLAYEQIKVPGTKVTLAPDGPSKVNLPTWAWLDKGDFSPVSVTASLDAPGLHIEATTTAKPVALSIKPGTEDAVRIPASGKCELNDDGSIGEPYAKGKSKEQPPCGVTYQRSSGNGTFNLQATATWDITWTGTDGAGGDLPDGEYGNDQPVTVEEVQSVNR